MEALKAYVDQRFAAIDLASTKDEHGIEKRFESVNEFRAVLSDQATRLMPRAEFDAQSLGIDRRITAAVGRIDAMQLVLTELTASRAGRNDGLGMVGTIVLGAVTALSSTLLIITFVSQHLH